LTDDKLSEEEKRIVGKAQTVSDDVDAEPVAVRTPEPSAMERKREPIPVRVQRTFRLYPELLEALSEVSTKRKQEGYELWSQDAIINHALSEWLRTNGY
jgi:hypothetical protein